LIALLLRRRHLELDLGEAADERFVLQHGAEHIAVAQHCKRHGSNSRPTPNMTQLTPAQHPQGQH
jgi:hypothetical protein